MKSRLAADPDPRGLRLRGARISGRLDLENRITDVNLELNDCLLEEGVLARGARLAGFGLLRCQIEHPAEPPLDAERLTCNALILRGVRITGHTAAAAVHLLDAHIGGSLDCDGATLTNDSGPALLADNLEVGHVMLLRHGFTATGHGGDAAGRLIGADSGLGGVVRLAGAHTGAVRKT